MSTSDIAKTKTTYTYDTLGNLVYEKINKVADPHFCLTNLPKGDILDKHSSREMPVKMS